MQTPTCISKQFLLFRCAVLMFWFWVERSTLRWPERPIHSQDNSILIHILPTTNLLKMTLPFAYGCLESLRCVLMVWLTPYFRYRPCSVRVRVPRFSDSLLCDCTIPFLIISVTPLPVVLVFIDAIDWVIFIILSVTIPEVAFRVGGMSKTRESVLSSLLVIKSVRCFW